MDCYGFPPGCQALVQGLNAGACALTSGEGWWTVLFPIKSGIMQGCPLSGLLYAMVMDPPLRAIADGLAADDGGDANACADDVGAALTELASLQALRRPCAASAVWSRWPVGRIFGRSIASGGGWPTISRNWRVSKLPT